MKPLKVFAINLEKRQERKVSILNEFKEKDEFHLKVVKAQENVCGALGLWNTIIYILQSLVPDEEPYIVICEDDHQFIKSYNKEKLHELILEAQEREADVLLGGISWFNDAVQISPSMFWVDNFSGLQFTIIFRKFFKSILEREFKVGEAADFKISYLTEKKFVIYPFISTQKEFGYSDVTSQNNAIGRVTKIFDDVIEKFSQFDTVSSFYSKISNDGDNR